MPGVNSRDDDSSATHLCFCRYCWRVQRNGMTTFVLVEGHFPPLSHSLSAWEVRSGVDERIQHSCLTGGCFPSPCISEAPVGVLIKTLKIKISTGTLRVITMSVNSVSCFVQSHWLYVLCLRLELPPRTLVLKYPDSPFRFGEHCHIHTPG